MADGLATTFALLTKTENEAAVRALLPGLDSPHASIRDGALRSLLFRRNQAAHREILRRLHTLDDHARLIIEKHPGRMTGALREALLDEDPQLRTNAYRATVWLQEYDLVPVLLNVLEDPLHPGAVPATKALAQLADLLHEDLTKTEASPRRQDAHIFRPGVVAALEHSLRHFTKHKRREVLEAFLLLAQRDNNLLKEILQSPYHPAFVTLLDILSNTQHGSIIGLLLSYLDDPRAPSAVLSVMVKRSDLRFVQSLLHKIGREPSAATTTNLKRISTVCWARSGNVILDQLDDQSQHAAVRMLMAAGMPRGEVFPVISHLLLHGKRGGRRAAAEALAEFSGAEANALTLRALEDEDPQVQANVLVQIRGRGIPGALPRLVSMIDSRHAVVRKAARKSLAEFSFKRFLGAFDMLDEEVRHTTGALVRKIDPQTVPLLQVELASPARTRRLRALLMARAMECVPPLEPLIIPMLKDDDHVVRAEAAAALSQCDSDSSRTALEEAMHDNSPSVREACIRSLQEQNEFARWRNALADPRD